jgi:glucose-6-phosphate isomerase
LSVAAAGDGAWRRAFAARLWRRDATLRGAAPPGRPATRPFAWLDLPHTMRPEVAGLEAFAAEVRAAGLTHAVLLGSRDACLGPEALWQMLGVARGALALTVLPQGSSPAAGRSVAEAHDPRRTLFLVCSKSWASPELAALEEHFFAWSSAARGEGAGEGFIAITDPGSPLARRAADRGYRRVFLNPPDVDERESALSLFGLVPAALIGADLAALLASAERELEESRDDPTGGAGVVLGAALGSAALAGQYRLTLAFGPRWAPLGPWIARLFAGCVGRDGRGIVPVAGEPLGPAAIAEADRAFVATPDLDRGIGRQIAHRDGPAWLLDLEAPADLGAAFLRWEIAVATAAAVLGLDPVGDPGSD